MKLEKIENWYLNRTQPAFNDVEGATAIDMVGKNTAKINEIIDLVNTFTNDMEAYIKEFTEQTNKDYEAFKVSINQKIIDFIETVDLKLASQDKDITDFTTQVNNKVIEQDNKLSEQDTYIAETITYIKENLTAYIVENVTQILKECVESGSLDESIMNGIDGLQEQINTINTNLDTKANTSDVYTKSEVDTSLTSKANTTDVYNKTEVDELLANFEGGSGGIPEIVLTATSYSGIAAADTRTIGSVISEFASKGVNSGFVKLIFSNNPTETTHPVPMLCFIPRINNSYSTPTLYVVPDSRKCVYGSLSLNGSWSGSKYNAIGVNSNNIKTGSPYLPNASGSAVTINYNLGTSKTPTDNTHYTTKKYVDNAVSAKANTSDVYTKTEVDTALTDKANTADVYNKTEVDTSLASKFDSSKIILLSKESALGTEATDGVYSKTVNFDIPEELTVTTIKDYGILSSFIRTGETNSIYQKVETSNKRIEGYISGGSITSGPIVGAHCYGDTAGEAFTAYIVLMKLN